MKHFLLPIIDKIWKRDLGMFPKKTIKKGLFSLTQNVNGSKSNHTLHDNDDDILDNNELHYKIHNSKNTP